MTKKLIRPCVHHWIIETTQQQVAHGYCTKCAEERDFTENHVQVFTHKEQATHSIDLAHAEKVSRSENIIGVFQ